MEDVMNRIYRFAIVALVAVSSVSCTKNELDSARMAADGEKFTLSVSYESPVKTDLGEDLVPVWNAGDEVWASDGINTAKGVVEAQYAGRSCAEIEFSGLDASRKIYVAYPYSDEHRVADDGMYMFLPCAQDGSFASANLVGGSCEAGKKEVSLSNVTAILKFSFLREDLSSMEITGDGTALNACGDRIHIDLTAGHGTKYLACWPSTLASGSVMSFVSKDGRLGYIRTTHANELKAGVIYDMGEIDERIVFDSDAAEDLSAAESANCYVISTPGSYRIRTSKGNSGESVGDPSCSSLLWETVNTYKAPALHSLVSETAYDNGYLYFRIPENVSDGNALVSVRDGKGENLWSWHLWLLKEGVKDQQWSDGGSTFSGAVMMDRNLGALTATLYSSAYGLLYQWGRKDPFIGAYTSQAGTPLMRTDISEETGNVGYATANPVTIIVGETGDWLTEADYSLWSASQKTIYDPCPAGYHVPFLSVFNGITTSNTTWYDTGSNHGSRTKMGSEYVRFPAAGARDYEDGTSFNTEYYGYYWCEGRAFRFGDDDIQSRNLSRGYAASVRCQKNVTGEATMFYVKIQTTLNNFTVAAPKVSGNGFPSAAISWGDGSDEEPLSITGGQTHIYQEAGEYTIAVTGFSVSTFKVKTLGNVTEVDLSNF